MTNAPAVSRALRSAGWLPIPTQDYSREGIRVTRTAIAGRVSVVADFDSPALAAARTDAVAATLADCGFTVTRLGDNRLAVVR